MNEIHKNLYGLLVSPNRDLDYLEKIYKYIHRHKKEIFLNTIYKHGDTILHLISARGLDEIIDTLKKNFQRAQIKEIVDIKNDSTTTALHQAACYGYTEVCKKLLGLGVNINSLTNEKNTPTKTPTG